MEANGRDQRSRGIYEEFEKRLGDEQKRWAERHAAVAADMNRAAAQKPPDASAQSSSRGNSPQRKPGAGNKAQRGDGAGVEGALVPVRSNTAATTSPALKTPPAKATTAPLDSTQAAMRAAPRQGLMVLAGSDGSHAAAVAAAGSPLAPRGSARGTPPPGGTPTKALPAPTSSGSRETVLTAAATPRGGTQPLLRPTLISGGTPRSKSPNAAGSQPAPTPPGGHGAAASPTHLLSTPTLAMQTPGTPSRALASGVSPSSARGSSPGLAKSGSNSARGVSIGGTLFEK